MDLIFSAFFVVSILHMGEEYFYPGGFMNVMRSLNPKFAPLVTKTMAIIVNSLQLVLCIVVILIGENNLILSMSLAALLFINSLVHMGGCIKAKGYAPGVITGTLLYLPLSIYAYFHFARSGQLNMSGVIITGMLGLLYQSIPIVYLALASAIRRT